MDTPALRRRGPGGSDLPSYQDEGMDMDIDIDSPSEEPSESGSVSSFTGSPPTPSASDSDDDTGSSSSDIDGIMPVDFDDEANAGPEFDEEGDLLQDPGPPPGDPDSLRANAIKYALWFLELKFSGSASAAAITQHLCVTRACVADMKRDDADLSSIPIDFQQALTRTKHLLLRMI